MEYKNLVIKGFYRQIGKWLPFHNLGREVFLTPVTFNKNGWFTTGHNGTTISSFDTESDVSIYDDEAGITLYMDENHHYDLAIRQCKDGYSEQHKLGTFPLK